MKKSRNLMNEPAKANPKARNELIEDNKNPEKVFLAGLVFLLILLLIKIAMGE